MTSRQGVVIASSAEKPTWEIEDLRRAFDARGVQTTFLDLRAITVVADVPGSAPQVIDGRQPVEPPAIVVLRSTMRARSASMVLRMAWEPQGTWFVDAPSRFASDTSDKIASTMDRHNRGVGSPSYLVFDRSDAETVFGRHPLGPERPLLYKPVTGRQGRGIEVWHDAQTARSRVAALLGQGEDCLLLQHLEPIEAEYRVVLLLGESLAVVRKDRQSDALTANAATGATFVPVDESEGAAAGSFAMDNCVNDGLLGVDVARDGDGRLFIIEENYAPQFRAVAEATGRDLAGDIADGILQAHEQ